MIAAVVLVWVLVNRTSYGVLSSLAGRNPVMVVWQGAGLSRLGLTAFLISGGLAGLAGATKTLILGFATLSDAQWTLSGAVILMTLVGGMGTMLGPIVGALVVVALENKIGDVGKALAEATGVQWFNGLGESVSLVTGLIFIVCVLAFRRGIVGEVLHRWPRRNP